MICVTSGKQKLSANIISFFTTLYLFLWTLEQNISLHFPFPKFSLVGQVSLRWPQDTSLLEDFLIWISHSSWEDDNNSSVQFSRSVVSDSLWPHEPQHTRPPCPSPTLGVDSNSCPSSWWCHPAISSSTVPSPPAPNPSQHQGLFQWVRSSHQVAKVLEFQLQHQSFQWTTRTDLF